MKDVIITAKIPGNEEAGIAEQVCSATVKFAETVKEAVEAYGEEALLSNAFANWRVTLQGNIRNALKRGESADQIQSRLAVAKMGVATSGSKINPIDAYVAMFASATPERRAEMLKELQEKSSKG